VKFSKIGGDWGVYLIEPMPSHDERGFFARTVCKFEFSKLGLNSDFCQQSISFNPIAGTLRGMHWQKSPYSEEKLVRVTAGSIFDVIVDIRPESATYKKWHGLELSAFNKKQIYIPRGFAHGFQTLESNTEVLYEMTAEFKQDFSAGFIWNDPGVGIDWPYVQKRIIGPKDLCLANLHKLL